MGILEDTSKTVTRNQEVANDKLSKLVDVAEEQVKSQKSTNEHFVSLSKTADALTEETRINNKSLSDIHNEIKRITSAESHKLDKPLGKSHFDILFPLLGIVATLCVSLTAFIIAKSNPIYLSNFGLNLLDSSLTMICYCIDALLITYLILIILALIIELYHYGKTESIISERIDTFFEFVLVAPVEMIIKPVFQVILIVSLLILVIFSILTKNWLALSALVIVIIGYLILLKKINVKTATKNNKLFFGLFLVGTVLIILYFVMTALLIIANKVDVKFDKEFYQPGDSVRTSITIRSLSSVVIYNITYGDKYLLSGYINAFKIDPMFRTIPESIVLNDSYPRYIRVNYGYSLYPGVLPFMTFDYKLFIPYFNVTSSLETPSLNYNVTCNFQMNNITVNLSNNKTNIVLNNYCFVSNISTINNYAFIENVSKN